MIPYRQFKRIFDDKIFAKSKEDLLTKVAHNPDRYVGLFSPTKPHAKLLQNLLQTNEFSFGDAFECVIERYLESEGWRILPKNIISVDKKERLNIDQLAEKNGRVVFIEQKVRDDHDSTKKRGQIDNFERKLEVLVSVYGGNLSKGFFYFIDPSLVKNRKFYEEKLDKLQEAYGVALYVCYGEELFSLMGIPRVWDSIIENLTKWRESIPDLPEGNFDIEPQESFREIKDLPLSVYRKLFDDERIVEQILPVIFPGGNTLRLLLAHISKHKTVNADTVAQMIRDYLEKQNQ